MTTDNPQHPLLEANLVRLALSRRFLTDKKFADAVLDGVPQEKESLS